MVRLPTTKELAEKRSKVTVRVGELLKATENRALSDEERSEFSNLQNEAEEIEKFSQDHQMRSQMQRLAAIDPQNALDVRLDSDNPLNRLGEYRLLRALRAVDDGKEIRGLEGEISQKIREENLALGVDVRGEFRFPHSLPMLYRPEIRANAVTNVTTAAGALQTAVASTFIDVLRNELILQRAGAQVVPGLIGTFDLPRKTNKSAGTWVGEDALQDAVATTFGKSTFSPKNVTASSVISRDLMKQVSLDMEMIARMDILTGLAEAIDLAGFHGSGSSNQPQGIASNSSCATVAIGTNGGAMTWAKLMELQTTINAANAKSDRMVYITSAVGYGALATTLKVSGYPVYLSEGGNAAGRPVLVTNQVKTNLTKGTASGTCTAVFCGDFTNVLIGLWGSTDLLLDKITAKPSLTIDAWQTADIVIRQPAAITKCVDLVY